MSSWLLKISLYSSVINLATLPFSALISRIFGYLTIILFFLSVIQCVFRNKKLVLKKTAIGFIVVIIVGMMTSLPSLGLGSIGNIIDQFLSIISFVLFYVSMLSDSEEQRGFVLEDLYRINYILCFIILAFAFGPFDFKYEIINEYGGKLFTLGLGNPNGVSLYIMFSIVFLMIHFYKKKKISLRIIDLGLIVAMVYVLYLLESRTVFICTLCVLIAFLLKAPKAFTWFSYFVVLAPVLMIIFQLQIRNLNTVSIVILGKAINTGRPEVYTRILTDISSSLPKIIFGDLFGYSFSNAHNGLLSIFASVGLGGVVMYIVFWYQQLKKLRVMCVDTVQRIAFFTIMAVLIHSSSEAMGVVGTIPFSIFVVVIMKIAKGEIRSKYDGIAADRV